MPNSFSDIQKKSLELIDSIKQEVKDLDRELISLNKTLSQVLNKNSGTPDSVNAKIKEQGELIDKLNSKLQKQDEKLKQLITTKQKLKQRTSEEIVNQRALARASDLEAQSKSKIVGAYARLNAQRKIAKTRLQDLIFANGKNNSQVKIAQKEYDKLTKRVNEANKATSNFGKTGLGSAVRGFKNLIGAFGVVGGVTLFADFVTGTIDTIKELDKLNFTLEAVIENEGELARTRAFLNEISLKYGADLLTTSERYVKFSVAARNAGLELKEVEAIFETVTEASAVLGLKTDELSGIYLALEQMLSKGKVTTEELRRQLGERLPGAFDLAAKAMGVTSSELDGMLKKGEVLASDLLPKLRIEIENAFGLDTIDKVETLQTATQNLNTSWTMFIETLNNGSGVGRVWEGVLRNLSGIILEINDLLIGDEGLAENQAYADYFKELQDGMDETIPKFERIQQLREQQSDIEDKFIVAQEELQRLKKWDIFLKNEDTKAMEETVGVLRGQYKAIEEYINLLKTQKAPADKKEIEQGRTLAVVLAELKVEREKLIDSTKEQAPEILKNIARLELEKKAWENNTKAVKNNKKEKEQDPFPVIGSEQFYINQIRYLKELRSLVPMNTEAYADLTRQIEFWEAALNGSNSEMEEAVALMPEFEENMDKAIEKIEALREKSDDFLSGFTSDFFSDLGLDFIGNLITEFDEFEEMLDASQDKWAVWANTIMEVGQELYNFLNSAQNQYFNDQFERLELERDISIQFAGESTTAREEIDRQYEAKKKALLRREAKAKKETAIFNAVIDTAQAIIGLWANPGFPAAIPLAVLVGALGAAQIATISSQSVPEYFRGTMNAQEGWALVDEKRPEVHTDRWGNIKSLGEDGANMRYMAAGDKVYTSHSEYFNKELSGILDDNGILSSGLLPMVNINNDGLKKEDFVREIRGLRSDINNKESFVMNLDKNGVSVYGTKQGQIKEYQNNVLRLKGRIV
jgi:tape measure domain-containing protein